MCVVKPVAWALGLCIGGLHVAVLVRKVTSSFCHQVRSSNDCVS
jgi:hypothetical protein